MIDSSVNPNARMLKYKVPNFKILDRNHVNRNKDLSSGKDSLANVSTVRQSDDRQKSPDNYYAVRDSKMRNRTFENPIRKEMHSQNISKRSDLYKDIRNRTNLNASSKIIADPMSIRGSIVGFDATKSTQQDLKES